MICQENFFYSLLVMYDNCNLIRNTDLYENIWKLYLHPIPEFITLKQPHTLQNYYCFTKTECSIPGTSPTLEM